MKRILTIILLCSSFLVGCNSDKDFNNAIEMGNDSLLNNNYESALEYFSLALEEKNDDELANTLHSQTKFFIKGLDYFENSNYDDALDAFIKVTTYSNGSELLLNKAKENIEEIQKHKELKDSIDENITLAKNYYSNKEYEQSLESIKSAIDLIGNNDTYKSEKEYLIELEETCKKSIEQIKLQEEERKKQEIEKANEQANNSSNNISESQAIKILEKYLSNQIGYIPNSIEVYETINGKYHLNVNHYDENDIRCTFGWFWVDMKTGNVSR